MNMYGLPALRYATGGDIKAAYEMLLERQPDQGGFDWWSQNMADVVNQAQGTNYKSLADVPPEKVFEFIGNAAAGAESAAIDPGEIAAETQQYISQISQPTDTSTATSGETQQLSPIEQLYQDILKRGADTSGLEYYTKKFGETVEPGERELFIRNAVGQGELTQAQADALLNVTPAAGTAPTAAQPEDMINRLLYQPILGRTGDPGGLEFYRGQFLGEGDTMISPQERARFIQGALESGELSQRAADAYLGTIPGLPRFLPAGAAAVGRVDPNFLRTAAPTIATNPVTGQPQLQGATSLIQGGATPVAAAAPFAEGGEVEYAGSRALAPSELGSKFNISEFVDEQGRLVSGYSRPIRDEFGTILGYEDRPYEQNVVFNPRLREREEEARAKLAQGGLANAAQNLARRGRGGDSMLVHMAPEEVSGLRALARAQGNDLTINPNTGLPEAFSLKKLFKAASFILPFVPIPGLFGMSSLLTRSILSGVAAGASAKGGFDLKQALGGGLRAYALGSLGEKLGGGPAQAGGPAAPAPTVPEAAAVNPMGPSVESGLTPYADISKMPISSTEITAPIPQGSTYTGSINLPSGPITPTTPVDAMMGATPPAPVASSSVITPEGQGFGKPLTKGFDIAAAGIGGLSLEEGAKEARNVELQAAAVKQADEKRQREFEELFRRTLGTVPVRSGGQINLAKGGMTYMEAGGTTGPTGEPRVVQGTGDGMSDSVPATIEGVQEARLANDEFVIPADVVSDIGNGSSDAGAKKLYGMMDRVRKARHGTTKQPPEINAESMMPA